MSLLRSAYRAPRRLAAARRRPQLARSLVVFGWPPNPGPADEVALEAAAILLPCYRRMVLGILGSSLT